MCWDSARGVIDKKVAILPVLRRNDRRGYFLYGFLGICAVIQHVPKKNTAAVYHAGRLIPFLDINSQDRDMKAFFVDPVHTLVGKNGQKIEIKLFLIRAAKLEHPGSSSPPFRIASRTSGL